MNPRDTVLSIGIAWLAFSIIAIAAGVFSHIQDAFFRFSSQNAPIDFPLLDIFLTYKREAATTQIIIGIIMAICAIAFIKRRNWARRVLQLLAGINIIWSLLFGLTWIRAVNTLTTADTDASLFGINGVIMISFGIGVILITIAMWLSCIRLLNRQEIRIEFSKRYQQT